MRQSRWLVALGLLAVACPGQKPVPISPVAAPAAAPPPAEPVVWRSSKSGLGFRLSDAEPPPEPRPKVAPAKPLSAAETARLVARLPPFEIPPEEKAFALREKSLPPPRPGETLKTPFPPPVAPPGGPPAATQGPPVSLARWAPEGKVDVAPNLSLTFSEPMVELTAHADLAVLKPPVVLRPQPPGRFRWVGTQTLLFEPDGERFPKATDYTVEIPSGTKSALGRPLAESKPFTFSLPTVEVEQFYPDGYPQKLEPLFFARMNQRVDSRAVLAHVTIVPTSPTGSAVELRLATKDEIEADDTVRRLLAHAENGRTIAFRATSPLPKATNFKVTFQRGLPSAEGPKVTTADKSYSFATYGPMTFETVTCGWYETCAPLAEWEVRFSNPIDAGKFDRALVRVEPPLPFMKVNVSSGVISIQGRSKGRTKYKVRVGAGLRDTFGQVLEKDAEGSIYVNRAKPKLFPEEHELSVLDPAFKPTLGVYSVNYPTLRVRLYQVGPEHYPKYEKYRYDYDGDGNVTTPPGRLVLDQTVRPSAKPDELVETRIDLARALTDGTGQVLVVVEPPVQRPPTSRWDREREWVRTWVEVTKLGLQAFREPTAVHGWVTKLADGSPVAGAELGVLKEGEPFPSTPGSLLTKADGMASLALGDSGTNVFARVGKDSVFLPGGGDSVFARVGDSARLLWFVMDDRNLYKPGERFNGKGWLRVATTGKAGDVGRLPAGNYSLDWEVHDPQANKIGKGSTAVDPDGGFNLSFDLPKNTNLGTAWVAFTLKSSARFNNHTESHQFQIQEFRRPEFEVTAETTEGPHYVGNHAIATLRATYYAGGSLPESDVRWQVSAADAQFSPPNRQGYQFGKPPERWWWFASRTQKRRAEETWESKTTAGGEHRLRVDFDALEPSYPRKIDFEASVTDVNRQAWTARTSLLVHPANVTVGVRVDNALPTAGQNLQVGALVTDIEGKAIPGRPVSVRCARIETTWSGDGALENEADPVTCDVTSAAEDARCVCATKEGGMHRITAVVTDEHGRKSTTLVNLWVLGGDAPLAQGVTRGDVDVIPDKTEYRGGDEARLLVMAPFAPAEGVLTVEREGIVELRRFRLEKRVGTVTVRLDKSWIPGVRASVRLVGASVRENEAGDPDPGLPPRPAYANGVARLELPPAERELAISISTKPKELEPGGTTRIGIDVKDAAGKATPGATVSLVVVDESVLALAGYQAPDPLAVFYGQRDPGVQSYETHDLVLLGKPDLSRMAIEADENDKPREVAKEGGAAVMGGNVGYGSGHGRLGGSHKTSAPKLRSAAKPMASAAPRPAPAPGAKKVITVSEVAIEGVPEKFAVRTNFDPLAAFVPRLVTDARGHVDANVKLPDSLTRYRVTAVVAANQNQFGIAESDVTARLPLMVRPSAPRFMNFGDRAELPVVLQNQTNEPMTVDTVLRVGNLTLVDPSAQRVTVPAADRVEVRFPIAARKAGTARIQIGSTGTVNPKRAYSDAAELEFPVWTPATTEAFATYGVLDQGAMAQPVRMPSRVVKEFGELDITTSSTALQGLSDAVLYLVRYPFD
ncbi:MAG TPA: alpha-2-macroglobulin family protein, partial [Polyangiaceae bacterium]